MPARSRAAAPAPIGGSPGPAPLTPRHAEGVGFRAMPQLWRESRLPAERLALAVDPVWRCEGVPQGDGSPVLLVAGFLAGDPTLGTMAAWLKRLGYQPRRAGLRANVDCATRSADRLEERIRELHAQTGRRVSIVGQGR